MARIPEADWKVFRSLREVALERLCERILAEVAELSAQPDTSYHQRYLTVYSKIQECDDDIARTFNDAGRSTAVMQLLAMVGLDLIEDEEFERFTPETQAKIDGLLAPLTVERPSRGTRGSGSDGKATEKSTGTGESS